MLMFKSWSIISLQNDGDLPPKYEDINSTVGVTPDYSARIDGISENLPPPPKYSEVTNAGYNNDEKMRY